jgi:serine/threonine-protein kinase
MVIFGFMTSRVADGSGTEERLTSSDLTTTGFSVSPDGQVLASSGASGPGRFSNIWVVPLRSGSRQAGTEDPKPRPFLQTRFTEFAPEFSPDGRWLAYTSAESGRFEVYVRPFPGPGGKFQISADGGTDPVWARNGRGLFYWSGTRMMAVDITTDPTFRAGTPRMLFEGANYNQTPTSRADFDVSPDGQRFLMVKAAAANQNSLDQIHVVLNWFEELKRRVPAGQ